MTEMLGWPEVGPTALATAAVVLMTLLIGTIANLAQRSRRQLPPGTRGWPILGSLPLLGKLPHQSLFQLSKPDGPLKFMRLGSLRNLVATSPKFAKEILKTQDTIMASRPAHISTGLSVSQPSDLNNITQMMINQSFCVQRTSGSKAADLPTMSKLSPKHITELLELLGTFNIADLILVLKPFDPQGLHKHAKALHQKLDMFIEEIIEEHRHKRSMANTANFKQDFVDAPLGFRHTNEFEESLSVDSMKAIMLDMVSAAGDTSSIIPCGHLLCF
ncbi:unnamed protein product [Calypogeia fissa]